MESSSSSSWEDVANELVEDSRIPYCYVVVPTASIASPRYYECKNLDSFLDSLYQALLEVKEGWAYVFLNGYRWALSEALMGFVLRGPEGNELPLKAGGSIEFKEGGSFRCLS